VYEIMPDAKIIFIMRSPLERPWSAMDMRTRIRGESIEEIKDKKFYRRFDARGSWLRTVYSRTLENWGAFYPEDQIFVGFLEDVHLFPGRLLGSSTIFWAWTQTSGPRAPTAGSTRASRRPYPRGSPSTSPAPTTRKFRPSTNA
jgi:hypothetical protein